jgi:hypothetical protein
MEAATNSIQSELEKIVKNCVHILVPVDQWAQGLYEELNIKTEETQLGLQAVTTSFYKRTKSIHEEFSAEIVDTKKGFHEELNLRIPETE